MIRSWAVLLGAIVTIWSLAPPPIAHAQDVHSHCIEIDLKPPGDCVITQPKVLIVYWDTGVAQWNADAGAANTRDRIDAHLLALTRSTYFSQLGQYHISAPEFVGSVTSGSCQAPQTVGGPIPAFVGVANLGDMNSLLDCVKRNHPQSFENATLAVLLIPPQVTPAWVTNLVPNIDVFGNESHNSPALPSCDAFGAFHLILAKIPTAVIPLKCSGDFPTVLSNISHEVIEAVTDPDSILQGGYVDTTPGHNMGQFGSVLVAPEIADLCEATTADTPFLDGGVAQYWSQASMGCVSGFDTDKPPAVVTDLALCGGGRNMRVTVQGTDFGLLPSDASAPGSSLYFGYAESASTATPPAGACFRFTEPPLVPAPAFQAGHLFAPLDSGVTAQFLSWDNIQIRLGGFAGAYGTSPRVTTPGHLARVEVANQETGTLSCFGPVLLPAPTRIVGTPTPAIPVGQRGSVGGTVIDGSATHPGCGHEAVAVTVSASAGSLDTELLVSDADGEFRTQFTAPNLAGPITILANAAPIVGQWTVNVAPVVTEVAPAHVDTAGGTHVTITGRGFVADATVVKFNGVAAPAQVRSSTSLSVDAPPSPSTGPASVAVLVHDVPSASAPQVTYVPAFGPFLTFFDASCGKASVSADVFDHAGAPVAGQMVSLTADSGSFVAASGPVATLSADTDTSGRMTGRMATPSAAATAIAVSGHTQARPTPDEHANVRLISRATCDTFRNFTKRNLPVRVTVGEELGARIVDGCLACVDPSRFRVQWQARAPILAGLSLTALTDDADIARNVTISVLASDKAAAVLKRVPALGNIVALIELRGNLNKALLRLDYADAGKTSERVALVQLHQGKWIAVEPIHPAAPHLAARLSAAGTYAIVAR